MFVKKCIILINENLEVVWSAELSFKYASENFYCRDIDFGSDGNFYFFLSSFEEPIFTSDSVTQRDFIDSHAENMVLKLDTSTGIADRKIFNTNNKSLAVDYFGLHNSNVVVSGLELDDFVNSDNDVVQITKNYFGFNASEHPIDTLIEFFNVSKDVLNMFERPNLRNDISAPVLNVFDRVSNWQFHPIDNGIVIIGEQEYSEEYNTADNHGSSVVERERRIRGDILICKIGFGNESSWFTKIGKFERSSGVFTEEFSFKFIPTDSGVHYLVFEDDQNNSNLTERDVPAIFYSNTPGEVVSYEINNKTGELNRKLLVDLKPLNLFHFNPSGTVVFNEDYLVGEVYKKGNEDVLIKIKFK